jgi:hypothetical protein
MWFHFGVTRRKEVNRPLRLLFALILVSVFALPACNRQKATIIPKLQINKKAAEMGTPIELTYSFTTKKDYVALNRDLWVFCHFLDPKRVIRFQDDHQPSIATSQWRPGQTYHYSRTLFIPKNIPHGEYTISAGIYAPGKDERLELDATSLDHRAYNMGTFTIEIPPQEPIIQYKSGWYDPESFPNDPQVQWRWTKKEAVMRVRNPNVDALLYFKADANSDRFGTDPQKVTVKVGDTPIDTFPMVGNQPILKKYTISKDKLGPGKMLELKVEVDKTFRPAEDKVSADTRELGIRIYELYLGKAND